MNWFQKSQIQKYPEYLSLEIELQIADHQEEPYSLWILSNRKCFRRGFCIDFQYSSGPRKKKEKKIYCVILQQQKRLEILSNSLITCCCV